MAVRCVGPLNTYFSETISQRRRLGSLGPVAALTKALGRRNGNASGGREARLDAKRASPLSPRPLLPLSDASFALKPAWAQWAHMRSALVQTAARIKSDVIGTKTGSLLPLRKSPEHIPDALSEGLPWIVKRANRAQRREERGRGAEKTGREEGRRELQLS